MDPNLTPPIRPAAVFQGAYALSAAAPPMATFRFARVNADGSAFGAELQVPANTSAGLLLVGGVLVIALLLALSAS